MSQTPHYLVFGSNPITKFCGAGFHEGTDDNPLLCCDGKVKAFAGSITTPCNCPCHKEKGGKYAPASNLDMY